MHKYRPDKSLGSSWHPWVRNGKPELPIQEDETALVIYALLIAFFVVVAVVVAMGELAVVVRVGVPVGAVLPLAPIYFLAPAEE